MTRKSIRDIGEQMRALNCDLALVLGNQAFHQMSNDKKRFKITKDGVVDAETGESRVLDDTCYKQAIDHLCDKLIGSEQ